MGNKNDKYCPDIAIPPGDTLLEILEDIGMTQAELAKRMGRPKKTINEIIKGKSAITPDTAIQLERVLNVPAHFWNNLEMNYRADLARISAAEELVAGKEWLKKFPLTRMRKYGWIMDCKDVAMKVHQLLSFFGVASIAAWENKWGCLPVGRIAFRKSKTYAVDLPALAVWLRRGEIAAAGMNIASFDRDGFLAGVKKIREMTTTPIQDVLDEIVEICANNGVAVVFTKELPKVPVHGITRWVSSDRAIIQLSLRYRTDDQFWFSFFHEAGHVFLHGKHDFAYEGEDADREDEADRFASEQLIPNAAYAYFVQVCGTYYTESAVSEFADSQNIAPGIVVGRLQHEKKIPYSRLNTLKRKLQWSS
ncbi:HigA family addiction module antitoxin [Selenomonas dianae]|uniref:ImmA/IrrE family metallo-endopeptidase n=1 Tax=Selenomonas dianae TaxID=135079 RepID=A0ABN0TCF2_9FIRM|nr:HigA family addiction module antitoxin [Selenomonas dianae]WLD82602.1 HigA family addiction module antitoxin [Selenomonas dianae]